MRKSLQSILKARQHVRRTEAELRRSLKTGIPLSRRKYIEPLRKSKKCVNDNLVISFPNALERPSTIHDAAALKSIEELSPKKKMDFTTKWQVQQAPRQVSIEPINR